MIDYSFHLYICPWMFMHSFIKWYLSLQVVFIWTTLYLAFCNIAYFLSTLRYQSTNLVLPCGILCYLAVPCVTLRYFVGLWCLVWPTPRKDVGSRKPSTHMRVDVAALLRPGISRCPVSKRQIVLKRDHSSQQHCCRGGETHQQVADPVPTKIWQCQRCRLYLLRSSVINRSWSEFHRMDDDGAGLQWWLLTRKPRRRSPR